MAPLIREFQQHSDSFQTLVCVTAQHRQMLDQVLDFFSIRPDYDLNLMQPNQTLFDITTKGLKGLETVLKDARPDLVFVQGDTTTAFVGALAAYYLQIPVAHLEAGLRSGNKYSPFPEEANRTMAGHLADYHFAPTSQAKANLLREGVSRNIFVVGNTVIDALLLGLSILKNKGEQAYQRYFQGIDFSRKIILVTGHRRESFGEPFENSCLAIRDLAQTFPEVEMVYPVHLNPNVQEPVRRILSKQSNAHLIDPLDYPYLIWLMNRSYLVLTDSGGIQEEAPSLGKPVVVMRDVTERQEGIDAGTAVLVGTDRQKIYDTVSSLLRDPAYYARMAQAVNPYGDGTTSRQIVECLRAQWS
jgi:UDP-N-acetylglucosamine 2-epimerase (non-hydrolysing)